MTREKTMEVRKIVSLPEGMAKEIDDYRFEHRLRTEAEALRELLRAGLDIKARKKK